MIETFQKEIDGATYQITQLPARRALKLQAKLIKLFGGVIGNFCLGNGKDTDEKIVNAIQSLSYTIDENNFDSLCMEILQGVRKNGVELTPATIDLEFAGDMAGIYKLIFEVLKVNFENFFTMLGIGNQSMLQPSQAVTKKTFTRI